MIDPLPSSLPPAEPPAEPVDPADDMPAGVPEEVTAWLRRHGGAGPGIASALFERLYADLRRIAAQQLRRERPDHTLAPTELLHEAWFRMAGQSRTDWHNRSQFLAVASTMMRRILVDHALARRAAKRGGDAVSVTLTGLELPDRGSDRDVVAVHEALLALEAADARAARVVELRFFGGFEQEEVAALLGLSPATVKRDWAFARAFMHRELARR